MTDNAMNDLDELYLQQSDMGALEEYLAMIGGKHDEAFMNYLRAMPEKRTFLGVDELLGLTPITPESAGVTKITSRDGVDRVLGLDANDVDDYQVTIMMESLSEIASLIQAAFVSLGECFRELGEMTSGIAEALREKK